jgi:hypothetical protein
MANPLVFSDLRRRSHMTDSSVWCASQPDSTSAASTVMLSFSPKAAQRLRQLAVTYAAGSNSEVIRRALHLYDWCRTAELQGASLLLKSSDDMVREIQLP